MGSGVIVLDTENPNPIGDKVKGQEVTKGSAVVGNQPRKKLSDISNLPQKNQEVKPLSATINTKEYIQKLHQENLTLVKLLADRNKIIQSHALELQRLRTECQQVQQKNMELARSNSQMLAELNANRDRLKVLQHELGCKNCLLNAMKLEIEVRTTEAGKVSQAQKGRDEVCNKRRKILSKSLDLAKPVHFKEKTEKNRKSAEVKSGDENQTGDTFDITSDPATYEPVQAKKHVDETRRCLRRQSARFKVSEQEIADGSFQTRDDLDVTLDPPTDKLVKAKKHVDKMRLQINDDIQINNRRRSRRQSARFKASEQEMPDGLFQTSDDLDPSEPEPLQAEKKADSKRVCARRQSARLRGEEQVQEPTEDVFRVDDAKFPISPLSKSGPASSVSATDSASVSESQESRRLSFRPKRQVVEKVQSYKEVPLNVKMRRPA